MGGSNNGELIHSDFLSRVQRFVDPELTGDGNATSDTNDDVDSSVRSGERAKDSSKIMAEADDLALGRTTEAGLEAFDDVVNQNTEAIDAEDSRQDLDHFFADEEEPSHSEFFSSEGSLYVEIESEESETGLDTFDDVMERSTEAIDAEEMQQELEDFFADEEKPWLFSEQSQKLTRPGASDDLLGQSTEATDAELDYFSPHELPSQFEYLSSEGGLHIDKESEEYEEDRTSRRSKVEARESLDFADDIAQRQSTLNEGQRVAYDCAMGGRNLFITGSAGTGKSFVLELIIDSLRELHSFDAVGVTALTGVAAQAIGACSLHCQLGIGVSLDKRKAFGRLKTKSIAQFKVLVIDEISMASGELLESIDQKFKEIRKSDEPFGGVQIIFSGDFYQLPPVPTRKRFLKKLLEFQADQIDNYMLNFGLAFQSRAWMNGNISIVELREAERQKDPFFIRALEDFRLGKKTENTESFFLRSSRELADSGSGILPTKLFSRNSRADEFNESKLEELSSDEGDFSYEATDKITISKSLLVAIERTSKALSRISTTGKQNLTEKQRRKMQRLEKKSQEVSGKAERAKLLLKSNSFFSHCRAPQLLRLKVGAQVMLLKNYWSSADQDEQALVNGSQGIVSGFTEDEYPIVDFFQGTRKVVKETWFESSIANVGTCSRIQIPLMLCWAVTIHKSQGQTLDRLSVDVSNMFAPGQLYVALSRGRTLDGIEIVGDVNRVPQYRNYAVDCFYADVADGEFRRTQLWSEKRDTFVVKLLADIKEKEEKEKKAESEKPKKNKRRGRRKGS
eukprot:CAMPEP_0113962864 /NCGR_PEP_ID=MMETSP0011_2-20120614/6181_1 /TAXON_ID=101924 /ORGANISM="Rhodosorus marinus" /LENGTH=794 /DNA_ID=CAMNT_0000974823 /DNA_START=253 /DNA_END=2637 /DNA_ORIENTATION=- /assembly_acc=CAM_ASM_000156